MSAPETAPETVATAPTDAPRLRGPVVAGLVGKAAEAVTLVLLATLVPRWLGPADYGLFSVATTVVAIGSVAMTLGGATLLARYVPGAVPGERAALARSLSLRLGRNRAALFAALVVAGAVLVLVDPARFPPVLTALVLLALALNVVATLALQADLGLGRTAAWCARYPVQNAVLIVAAIVLYEMWGVPGAVLAIVVAGVVAFGLGAVVITPLLRQDLPQVTVPDGALRFGFLQAAGGALVQVAQRGGVIAVALLSGSAHETGYVALAIGVSLAATYAVVQVFTVSLPGLTASARNGVVADAEAALRRLAGVLLAVLVPGAVLGVVVIGIVVPVVFGHDYSGAVAAFGPALAMVVLAPVNALAVQTAALRMRSEATLWSSLAGAVAFVVVALLAVPVWGAAGATGAALAAAATSAVFAVRLLPGAIGIRLAVASLGGAAAVVVIGVLT